MPDNTDEKISPEFFTLLYNHIASSTDKTYDLGKAIGSRLADDFILHVSITRKLTLDEFILAIQRSFFPHYFSYRPERRANKLVFDHFYLLKYHGRVRKGVLDIFAGILDAIAECLCRSVYVVDESGECWCLAFYDGGLDRVGMYEIEMVE